MFSLENKVSVLQSVKWRYRAVWHFFCFLPVKGGLKYIICSRTNLQKGVHTMLKMIITEAVVSKGYDGAPAIRFYDAEGGSQIANLRIGKRVYDSRAENNHRWLNFNVKAFGDVCERIKRMKLKEGSYINLIARYDEESWEDKNSHETKTGAVLILEEVEFSGSGGGQKNGQGSTTGGTGSQGQQPMQGQPPQPDASMPGNFTGYEGFGSTENPFF